jgi:predicted DsbA family dithiol-disulfide isomerase
MKIEIWSDFACPYCYLGEHKLKQAIAQMKTEEKIEITFKAFQLDPNATRVTGDLNEFIAKKYNTTYQRAKQQNDYMVKVAKEVGLDYRLDILIQNNTSMAHQASKFAKEYGKETILADKFFKAYFEEGKDIGDLETILELARESGLDSDKLKKALAVKTYLTQVRKDQALANSLDIHSVPYFVIDNKVAVSGAQSVDHFIGAINKALELKNN